MKSDRQNLLDEIVAIKKILATTDVNNDSAYTIDAYERILETMQAKYLKDTLHYYDVK